MKIKRLARRQSLLIVLIFFFACCGWSLVWFASSPPVFVQAFWHIKAFCYYYLSIPTDSTIHVSQDHNVLRYNEHSMHYLINNPDLCLENTPFLIIFVKSCPVHFKERETIRQTWGNLSVWPNLDHSHKAVVLFVMGINKMHTESLQSSLVEENKKYKDLIQENFVEHFHNLTLKLVSHLKWPLVYCKQAKYWMTTDEDVFVNVKNVVSLLKNSRTSSLYVGRAHLGAAIDRNKYSKYYVPHVVYRGVYYPGYCPGAGYVLSMDVVAKVFAQVPNIPLLYIDDVYMGFLAGSVGISPSHYVMFFGERKTSMDLCTLSMFLTSHRHKDEEMYGLFREVMNVMAVDANVVCWGKMLSKVNPYDFVYF